MRVVAAPSAEERLHGLIEPTVCALGYELVGFEFNPGRGRALLRVYIDSGSGITVADCERVSHQLSGVLDVEDPIAGGYTLEVSSPGLDRPLFTPEHFVQYAGHEVRLRLRTTLAGRRRFKGTLKGFRDGHVLIVEEGVEQAVPHRLISSARLVPEV